MYISVVVPCYRSAGTLPALVHRLGAVLTQITQAYEVILVVDGSPDNTWDVAQALALRNGPVRAMLLARNYGQHSAIIAGVRAARYETVITMDDDLQHPPEEIPALVAALTPDLDLVYGIPHKEEHGVGRSLASRIAKLGMEGIGIQDAKLLSAFRIFRTFLRGGFDQIRGPNVAVDVALSWATTRVGAVTVKMDHRTEGRSGYTIKSLFQHMMNLLLGYSTKPLRMVTYAGMLALVSGLVLLGRSLWLYFHYHYTLTGADMPITVVFLLSAIQLIGLGLLGEYVGRIQSSGIGRPTYVIRQRVDDEHKLMAQTGIDSTLVSQRSNLDDDHQPTQ